MAVNAGVLKKRRRNLRLEGGNELSDYVWTMGKSICQVHKDVVAHLLRLLCNNLIFL